MRIGLGDGAVAQVVGTIASSIPEAVLAPRRGEHSRAVDLMKPILDRMDRVGGSHAQQDFLEQVFVDSAIKANRGDDVRPMLARVYGAVSNSNRIGYAQAARQFRH
jgi:hypothetical protein